jgi:peptidoglycan/LPS O-acetylase OafA/YrhL
MIQLLQPQVVHYKQEIPAGNRLDYIDRASGIAILLVVYAHILFPETLALGWYFKSENFIYKFHMPLFMCLSGYLAFLSTSNKKIRSAGTYLNFQKKKFFKFLPVYLFFSLYAILIDVFYKHITTKELQDSIFAFFFAPTKGSAVFVWYLYVLMGFYLITPLLLGLKSSSLFLLLAVGFLATNVTLTPLFCFDFFCKFFFFFLSGGLIYKYNDDFIGYLRSKGKWFVLAALLISVLDFLLDQRIPFQVICIALIPAILYITKLEWPPLLSKILITIGVGSFAIYLFNTTLINLYYIFFKSILKIQIGPLFIASCLIVTTLIALLIRTVFNKIVPAKIYAL